MDNFDILTSQSNFATRCYFFTFKLFTYIFNPNTKLFNSVKFSIYHAKEYIFKLMSSGLTENERKSQKDIYDECDIISYNCFFIIFIFICKT